MRRGLALLALLALGGCGFHPVYESRSQNHDTIQLSQVRVAPVPGRNGQQFTSALEDLLNPDALQVTPKYEVRSAFGVQLIPLTINEDGTISSFRVFFNTTMTLVDLAAGKVIHSAPVKRSNRYTVSEEEDFSSYVSREDAIARGTTELAREYFLKTATFLDRYASEKEKPLSPDVIPDPEIHQMRTPSIYDDRTTLNPKVPSYTPPDRPAEKDGLSDSPLEGGGASASGGVGGTTP